MTPASSAQAAWYDIFRWSNIKESFREAKERREETKRIQEKEKKKQEEELLNKNQETTLDNKEQAQQKETVQIESQATSTEIKVSQEQKPVAPPANTQSDTKTIESLKAEIATLKTNLDNLYKAHNGLVNKYNELLKYTTDLEKQYNASQNKSTVANTVSPDVLYRISELERKLKLTFDELYGDGLNKGLNLRVSSLESFRNNSTAAELKLRELEQEINNICHWAFNSFGNCPTIIIGGNLEKRIKILEGGY